MVLVSSQTPFFLRGGVHVPENAEKIYSNFSINRRQAQVLAFMVLSYDVENFIDEHHEEYERFLQDEKSK